MGPMKHVSTFFFRAWRPAVLVLALGLVSYVLFFHNLTHLLPGYDAGELSTYQDASNWHNIAHNPLNAPYKLIVLLAAVFGHHSILVTRIVAASFGVVAACLFYAIVRSWYGFRIAFLATLLFATSASFLHISRLGSSQIIQMAVLLLLCMAIWYRRFLHHRRLLGYGFAITLALLWYIPGMIWLELLGLIILHKPVFRVLRVVAPLHKISWIILFLLLITPLAIASVRTPSLIYGFAGLPEHFVSISHLGSNLVNTILSIGIRGTGGAELGVGHVPLLDVIELALGLMGAYFYIRHERSIRTLFLFGAGIITVALISLGGPVSFSCLVPLLYLFVAGGLNNLISQWLTVFPRNPIAKLTGLTLVCLMLSFSVLYQTRAYFVAWPHNNATRQLFSDKQP